MVTYKNNKQGRVCLKIFRCFPGNGKETRLTVWSTPFDATKETRYSVFKLIEI